MNHIYSAKRRAKMRWGIVGIVCLFLAALAVIFPHNVNKVVDGVNDSIALGLPRLSEDGFKLGLDLQGGAHLVYEADMSRIARGEEGGALDGVRDVVERRVGGLGVSEPQVQTTNVGDKYRLIVELPGVTDINQAIEMIGETPILEFKEENNTPPRELTEEEVAQLDTDNAEAKIRIDEAAAALAKGGDFAALVDQYSEDLSSKNNGGYLGFVGNLTVHPTLFDWAESANEGDVTRQALVTEQGYHLLQRGAAQDGAEQVSAKHILICYFGAQGCSEERSKEDAEALAQDLFDRANAANFEELALEYSNDPSVTLNNGDLGSFPRGMMLPAFEDAVFAAASGEITGPVETAFGYHVIYKTGQELAQEYELSQIFIPTKTAEDILPPPEQWSYTGLSGKQLDRAEVVTNAQTGQVEVSLQFDAEGATLFQEITRRNIGRRIAIFLDGDHITNPPVVNQEIAGGQAVIHGDFTLLEAREIAQRLNTGALPVPIELVSQQTVGASLGAVSLQMSLHAGMVGIALVMLFMLLYYRLPGLLSVFSLSLYIALTLALFKFLGVTLTLAGIAGFVLSIGMAVDANVLIFERLKEELNDGKSLKAAVEEGFLRAWTSIRDGNLSTMLISLILVFSFQSSFVRGFAVTLFLGILVSMFSAIIITRSLVRFVVPWVAEKRAQRWLFLGGKED